ncbi:hypothetical protein [Streptomyces sp. SID3343]|uniref:hypothetical protein n=1 Tax=Streptomyces sp. SID3343 TaxID=2690260 RepID=UPI0013710805|nr:hypothetical protein [Streptomyces sp. SID3343]MYV96800.1 hypothetical protein [Streptomyces sp. SID3343]
MRIRLVSLVGALALACALGAAGTATASTTSGEGSGGGTYQNCIKDQSFLALLNLNLELLNQCTGNQVNGS